ncbi:MAG TPA: hypothetical protein VIE36_14740 [Methylomirabilota bacterium]|jgi:hypothetical protein
MADKMKENKDAKSGEPVQLDKDMEQGGQQRPPQQPQQQPDQQQGGQHQAGQPHEGGQKR